MTNEHEDGERTKKKTYKKAETPCFAKLNAGVIRKRIRNGYPAKTHLSDTISFLKNKLVVKKGKN